MNGGTSVVLEALVVLLELADENVSTLLLGTVMNGSSSVVLQALVILLELRDEEVGTLLLVALAVSSVSSCASSVTGTRSKSEAVAAAVTAIAGLEAASVSLKTLEA
jgi:hypothetical protein